MSLLSGQVPVGYPPRILQALSLVPGPLLSAIDHPQFHRPNRDQGSAESPSRKVAVDQRQSLPVDIYDQRLRAAGGEKKISYV